MKELSEVKRIFDIPLYQKEKYDLDIALGHRINGPWATISSAQYLEYTKKIARALMAYGIKKGDKVGLVSGNRIEWTLMDQAIMRAGAVTVPVYPTITVDDYRYIMNHSEMRLCFTSDKSLYNKIEKVRADVPTLEGVYTFDDVPEAPSWKAFIEKYDDPSLQEKLDAVSDSVQEDDLSTLIYTSGTTGTPKGVMLTHRNIVQNVIVALPRVAAVKGTVALSFLPLCHVFQRTVDSAYQLLGCAVYYAKSTETVATDALTVKPRIMMVVPRVMERMYAKIMLKGEALKGLKKAIFFWAVRVGRRYVPNHNNIFYRMQLSIARKLVLSKWVDALGGELKIIISGSSKLDPRLSRLFSATGMELDEGYGLTESSPIISTNVHANDGIRIGSVGRPLENWDVKIADDGEILVKGPSVMKGYYKDPERTAEAIDEEGYLHTGDVGYMHKGFLYITDRKKEMFKTSGGKYITPQPMENALVHSNFIEQAMVVGEGKQHPGAIINVDKAALREWCQAKGISDDINAVLSDDRVRSMYRKEINVVNKGLSGWEKIKKFHLTADEWSVETGLITPTLKLKRRRLLDKYNDVIAEMYKDE